MVKPTEIFGGDERDYKTNTHYKLDKIYQNAERGEHVGMSRM